MAASETTTAPGATNPRITAFYGFKGGTGRSFLLATCAVALAAAGKRVLVLDWDLEAPGVGDLFDSTGNDIWVVWRRHKGVVELLQDPRLPPRTRLTEDNREQLKQTLADMLFPPHRTGPSDDDYIVDIVADGTNRGRLSLIGPGQYLSGSHYFGKFLESDWAWYFENQGTDFLVLLREVLLERGDFDEILIDARTGYSAFSIAAIRFLADCVCVVSTFSMQSINGVARVWPLFKGEGHMLRPYHILSRSPRGLHYRLQTDIDGKLALLREYGCPAFCELPVISNLHGGDGHLWSRDELLDGAADAPALVPPAESGVETAVQDPFGEYLRNLVGLLREVFPGVDIPEGKELTRMANDWWRQFVNKQSVIKPEFGGLQSWSSQQDEVDQEVAKVKARLENPPRRDSSSAPHDPAPPQSVETLRDPKGQGRPLAARALLAAKINVQFGTIRRPAGTTEKDWQERLEQVRREYGTDVSPVSPTRPAMEVESPPNPFQSLEATRDELHWGIGPTLQWFEDDDLVRLAAIGQRCALGKEPVSLLRRKNGEYDVLDALSLYADVLEYGRLLEIDVHYLTYDTLRRALGAAVERMTEEVGRGGLDTTTLFERLAGHERLSHSVRMAHDLAPLASRDMLVRAIEIVDKAFATRRRPKKLEDQIVYWSEQVVRLSLRTLLRRSSDRAAVTAAINALVNDFAGVIAGVGGGDAPFRHHLAEIGDRLGHLCVSVQAYLSAVRCLLPALRFEPSQNRAEALDAPLDRLISPSLLRATRAVAQSHRQRTAEPELDRAVAARAEVAALCREWREFGDGPLIEANGTVAYSTIAASLQGLQAWLKKASDQKGVAVTREREWLRAFYILHQLALGEDVDQEWKDTPEPNRFLSLQRARFLIARERYAEAAEALQRETRRVPEGSFVVGDLQGTFYASLGILVRLTEVLQSTLTSAEKLATYSQATRDLNMLHATVARRTFPFDVPLERLLRRGLRTAPAPAGNEDQPWSYERLGLSEGTEWPALSRLDLATIVLEFAEICVRCGEKAMAKNGVKDALTMLDLARGQAIPTKGFTAPLSARMAIPAATAFALDAKILGKPEALKDALAWATWDCSDHVNGAGRKMYYRRIFLWCAAGTPMEASIKGWLGPQASLLGPEVSTGGFSSRGRVMGEALADDAHERAVASPGT